MGGSVFIVGESTTKPESVMDLPYDHNGYSVPLRMAMYMTQLVQAKDVFENLGVAHRSDIFEMLLLTLKLANDNVSIAGTNNIWVSPTLENESEVLEFISDSQSLIRRWVGQQEQSTGSSTEEADAGLVPAIQGNLRQNSGAPSAKGFYNARAMSYLIEEDNVAHPQHSENRELILQVLRSLHTTSGMPIDNSFPWQQGLTSFRSRRIRQRLGIGRKPDP